MASIHVQKCKNYKRSVLAYRRIHSLSGLVYIFIDLADKMLDAVPLLDVRQSQLVVPRFQVLALVSQVLMRVHTIKIEQTPGLTPLMPGLTPLMPG